MLIAALLGLATAVAFDCPRQIDIQQTTRTADRAWEQVTDHGLPPAALQTVAVYADHPAEDGSLVPDATTTTARTAVTLWRLPPDSAPYWMACVYSNSRVLLAKKIPAEARQCALTAALREQQADDVVSFVCQ
ncbi:hypothetical protein FHW58_002339 [Duganella sp. 1224]|uniref:STY0301 family protein n=1 Tax=Duganella sp. 1224 TaxID=2587052 RepID=UPI0015C70CED|nr:STY0301 family protein [Duganella sp. 1224]NYE61187.1 hypothetical protein [Duganella sp. 1224]